MMQYVWHQFSWHRIHKDTKKIGIFAKTYHGLLNRR